MVEGLVELFNIYNQFLPPTPPHTHLDTSLDHRACRLIMGMLTIPCTMSSLALWQHERLCEHGFLCEFAELLTPMLFYCIFYLYIF